MTTIVSACDYLQDTALAIKEKDLRRELKPVKAKETLCTDLLLYLSRQSQVGDKKC
ncbi:MAG: hypothetical protein WBB19_06725 [Desulforhopalus sp.]